MRTLLFFGLASALWAAPAPFQSGAAQAQSEVVDMTAGGVQRGEEPAEQDVTPAAAQTSAPAARATGAEHAASAPVVSPSVAAANAEMAEVSRRPNALSFSVLGFIGRFRLTYERLVAERHGVFGEAIMSPGAITGFDFIGGGASAGYRFHWRGPIRGPFVGGIAAVEYGNGKMKVRPDFREDDEYLYRGSSVHLTVAVHAGYRWLFRRGFTITLRGGLGFAYAWTNPKPGAEKQAIDALEGAGPGIDGEASLGWAF